MKALFVALFLGALALISDTGCTPSARRVAHVAVVASGGVVAELQRASLATYERATSELIESGLRGADYANAVAPMDAELNARTEALALASDALFAVARALDANDANATALASDAATAIEHAVDVLRDEHALPAVAIPASVRREVIRLRSLSAGEDAGHADE